MAKKVFLGVGHGGSDPGAVFNGLKEKDLNLAIALSCSAELARHGVTVKLSRTKDQNDPLAEQIKMCNNFAPDLALNIHNNAGGGDGAEAYYHYKGGVSKTLANNVLTEIIKIGQNSRGAKIKKNILGKDYFGFIREISAPSVIIECAFLDNKKDVQIIDTANEQKKFGIAIAHGILKTLNIAVKATQPIKSATTNKTPTKPVSTQNKGVLYKVIGLWVNIRKGAGTNYAKNGTVKLGEVYHITEVKNGFGRLKSGAGWVSMSLMKKK